MIGQGGQADVWEAWQTSLDRLVALKIHRRGTREEFLREARLTGELDHPNIVPVLDLDEGEGGSGRLAMAMKRIRGRRWDDLISEDRAARGGEALRRHLEVLQSVCRAVSYAHARGIVHLDLKPGQVMVGEFGEVYLMDWGVAARIDETSSMPVRHVAQIAAPSGTPGYMAPEQALGDGQSIGVATDVYLLGALAYHAACGHPPHPGSRTEQILEAAKRNEIADPGDDVPAGLRRIAGRAMSLLPRDRHATADEFRLEIEEFLATSRQDAEARQLRAAVERERALLAEMDYPALVHLEQSLDRAEALAPGDAAAHALRDDVLAAHHARALHRSDLALARIVAERLRDPGRRDAALRGVSTAEDQLRRRESQRRTARRVSVVALSCAVAVLLGSSFVLRRSLATTNAERTRAENALVQSRRELGRASVQAALSHVEHQRDAEAREALLGAPPESRGWEWGYLANAAMPETRMLRPRGEVYRSVAVSADGSLLAAIRLDDDALVLVDPDASEGSEPLSVDRRKWSVLATGEGRFLLAGSPKGEIAKFDRGGQRSIGKVADGAVVAIAADGFAGAVAATGDGRAWRVSETGAVACMLETGAAIGALSARSGMVAIGSSDGRVWTSAAGGALVPSSFAHDAPVLGFAWHPSQDLVVSWAATSDVTQPLEDGRAIVHRAGRTEPVFVREDDGFAITAGAWSPGGDRLYLASSNTLIYEHETAAWSRLRSLLHSAGIVRSMDFMPAGGQLATFTWRNAEVRSIEDGIVPRSVRADSRRITGTALRASDIVLCGSDGGIGLWRTDRDEHARNFQVHRDRGHSLDMAAGAPVLASAHQTGKIMLWDTADPERAAAREIWFGGPIAQVRIAPDGSALAASEKGGKLHVIRSIATPAEDRRSWDVGSEILAVAISAGLEVVAAPADGGMFAVGNDPQPAPERSGDSHRWTALRHFPDGKRIAAGGEDGTIVAPDPKRHRSGPEFFGHTGAVRRLEFADDGRLMLSASDDGTGRLWDVESGRCLAVYRGTHAAAVTSAVLTPDGRRVLTSCLDSVVRVFDRETAIELLALEEHQYGVLDMAISTDGRTLFTTGQDNRVRAWFALPYDLSDGAFVHGVADLRGSPSSR